MNIEQLMRVSKGLSASAICRVLNRLDNRSNWYGFTSKRDCFNTLLSRNRYGVKLDTLPVAFEEERCILAAYSADKRVMVIKSKCGGCGEIFRTKDAGGPPGEMTTIVPAGKAPCCNDQAFEVAMRRRREGK